jgi:hypothetical protein
MVRFQKKVQREMAIITYGFAIFAAQPHFLWRRSWPTKILHSLFTSSLFRDSTFSDVRYMLWIMHPKRLHNKAPHWHFVIFTLAGNIGWLPESCPQTFLDGCTMPWCDHRKKFEDKNWRHHCDFPP